MGGAVLLDLALRHPRLLTTSVTVEPFLMPSPMGGGYIGAYALMNRPYEWSSREEAMKSFAKHPMYRNWDRRVLELFKQHALRDYGGDVKRATLTTTRDQEVALFARGAYPAQRENPPATFAPNPKSHPDFSADSKGHTVPFYRPEGTQLPKALASLRPPNLFVYGATTMFASTSPEFRKEIIKNVGTGVGGSRVRNGPDSIREHAMEVGSHFVPFERPADVISEAAGPWIEAQLAVWLTDEQERQAELAKVARTSRGQLPEDFRWWMEWSYGKGGKKRPTTSAGSKAAGDSKL
jgi:pimeloyl-ACP methyl ester carboxylesterase